MSYQAHNALMRIVESWNAEDFRCQGKPKMIWIEDLSYDMKHYVHEIYNLDSCIRSHLIWNQGPDIVVVRCF